ncbi:MAG: GTPase [Verrucomicrobiales bacterium]|nr:GTPase [Verrucomicrobiales bacterium]
MTTTQNGHLTTSPTSAGGPGTEEERIIRNHVLWSMGAGLIPVPLADLAGVTAIQMDALKKLAELHGIDYSEATGRRFVAALAGGAAARVGASVLKLLPGVGTVLGGLSMSAMSGASTYAVCQVAVKHFETHGNFLEIDLEDAKSAYHKALEKGKDIVESLKHREDDAKSVYENLEKIGELHRDGVLTDAEYKEKKAGLLAKLEAERGDDRENGENG